MVAAVYTVQYVIRRKNFSGQTFSHKREISMDSEIYKKNYNTAELTNFFKQSVAVYHNDLERFESFRFYKTCDKNNTEDSENYSNILNFFDKKKVNREIESSQKVSKPKKVFGEDPIG